MSNQVKREHTDDPRAGSSKRMKETEEQMTPVTSGGKCEDEITLVFDDKKELYVSKYFLIISSPVFQDMFRQKRYKKKKQNRVNVSGKKYEDFLEFLECINPGSLKDVNKINVLRIASIAEEYKVISCVSKCKAVTKNLLNEEHQELQNAGPFYSDAARMELLGLLRNCLYILHVAISLCYQDIIDQCIRNAACYPFGSYGETESDRFDSLPDQSKCKQWFEKSPIEIRCQILSKRIFYCEKGDIIRYTGE